MYAIPCEICKLKFINVIMANEDSIPKKLRIFILLHNFLHDTYDLVALDLSYN